MDPFYVTAARRIPQHQNSATDEIDAFYEDHAFERSHAVRRELGQIALFVRGAIGAAWVRAATRWNIAQTTRRA